MKKIKLLSLLSLFMVATFTSCTDDDKGERVYKGASLLNFHKGVSRDVFVFSGTGFTEKKNFLSGFYHVSGDKKL